MSNPSSSSTNKPAAADKEKSQSRRNQNKSKHSSFKRSTSSNSSRNNRRGRQQNKRPKTAPPNDGAKPPTAAHSRAETPSDDGAKPSAAEHSQAETSSHLALTKQRFGDLQISAESRRALNDVFGYEFMTPVQAETLPSILEGHDCFAKAKTGTGKTLGFLIPTIERIHGMKSSTTVPIHRNSRDINCLILSPTRELAFQITAEAKRMLRYHKNINVVSFVGGTNPKKDLHKLRESIQIVVATPGRLLDHLQNNGLAERMSKLSCLILDEADQLLDMGFRPDIVKVLQLLRPNQSKRQTLLFSATVPASVEEIANLALKPQYKFFDTVGENAGEQTHLHVRQELMVATQKDQFTAIASILERETCRENEHFKIIVFFTTARLTGFAADFFRSAKPGYEIIDIHSRKSQAQRQRASDRFRDSARAVLFSSDVSARGMDYPNVSFVLQVGLTDRASYTHRIGRTARAGKQGKGALLLADYEERHMKEELVDMPLECVVVPLASAAVEDFVARATRAVSSDKNLQLAAQQSYAAWLGCYKGNMKKCGFTPAKLVQAANDWARDVGLPHQPRLQKKTIGKMGLKGVPGLLVEGQEPRERQGRGRC